MKSNFTGSQSHLSTRRRALHGGAALAAWAVLQSGVTPAFAQKPPVNAPTNVPAPPVNPVLGSLNFLIIALDNIEPGQPAAAPVADKSGPQVPLLPTDGVSANANNRVAPIAPITPAVPGAVTPQLPTAPTAPAAPSAPIRPAAWGAMSAPQWVALAQRVLLAKDKQDPRDKEFVLKPEPRNPASLPGTATLPPVPSTVPDTEAPPSEFSAITTARTSRAQVAAIPLRRALVKAGCNDVLDTGLDGATIMRALNNRRLTARTLQNLQAAMTQLIQAGKADSDDAHLRAAVRNAARVGQTLGYRGVVALAVLPRGEATGGVAKPTVSATYGLVIVDSWRETGEPVVFDETGVDDVAMNESAALTGRGLIEKTARDWPPMTQENKRQLSLQYLGKARDAMANGKSDEALDYLNQSVALDAGQVEAYLLLGDLLAATDAGSAASEYNRAAELKPSDGKVWTKVAIAYTRSATPDWPRALEAARQALKLGYESAELRLAMAVAQWGRADIFKRYLREDRAREAEAEAKSHLDRALFLAPQDDSTVMRGIASQLVAQGRYKEGVQVLDKLSKLYPDDMELLSLLATALGGLPNQEEETFVAWAKVWKIKKQAQVSVDVARYAGLMEGFDRRLANLGKDAARLSGGVAQGGVPREQALLQVSRLKDDLSLAQDSIKIIVPPSLTYRTAHNSRIFAADLMTQAFGNHVMYLETGDDTFFNRAMDLQRQSVMTLNLIRTSRS
jgi:tetratricopeptide (TPR) repeat protein